MAGNLANVIRVQSFKMKFLGVTILQGVEFPTFLLIFAWALQQCSATALPVKMGVGVFINKCKKLPFYNNV